jgi:hypothetical protein
MKQKRQHFVSILVFDCMIDYLILDLGLWQLDKHTTQTEQTTTPNQLSFRGEVEEVATRSCPTHILKTVLFRKVFVVGWTTIESNLHAINADWHPRSIHRCIRFSWRGSSAVESRQSARWVIIDQGHRYKSPHPEITQPHSSALAYRTKQSSECWVNICCMDDWLLVYPINDDCRNDFMTSQRPIISFHPATIDR